MRTILVTGGAGLIGSHLCLKLLKQGKRVVCIDNLVSGNPDNLDDLKKFRNFVFIKKDIVKPIKIEEPLGEIYNLASTASPIYLTKYPIEILMTGSMGVKNMLDLAIKKRAKFLHTSTCEVYGDPQQHPQEESYWGNVDPIGVRSCYDEAKRFAESLIENYRKKYNLDTKIVRVFNTYGPRCRLDDGKVTSNFITQALKGKDLTVYGEGTQTRSFCYVSDMIEGTLKMMKSKEHGPINLGSPDERTILELAEKIIQLTKSKSKIVFLPHPIEDHTRRCPDITLAEKKLGWWPKVSLEKGLIKTIEYFRKVL